MVEEGVSTLGSALRPGLYLYSSDTIEDGKEQESRASDVYSYEKPHITSYKADTYMAFAGFNVNKTWRAKVEGRRKRGRGREETPLKSPEFKLLVYVKCKLKAKRDAASCEDAISRSSLKIPVSKSVGVTPRMVLVIVQGNEFTWDAKWRPVAEERASVILGFIVDIFWDGQPNRNFWKWPGSFWLERSEKEKKRKENEPLLV
uniref:Uncharacterized protein n=1 Tax=Physcomitrium patens TaxID=3218 RepID=A0A2K1L0N6_PHYPA|nr:hypothetical protein PHYPA_002373 [Physcomitrium patens]